MKKFESVRKAFPSLTGKTRYTSARNQVPILLSVHNDGITDFGFSALPFYLTINKKQAIRHHLIACDIMDYERRRFTPVAANKQALNRTVKIKFSGVKMLQSSPFYENLASCVISRQL